MGARGGVLVLLRHGQASALSGDYDQLSELGREQSRQLGAQLAALEVDRVLVGPRKRHAQTLEEARAALGRAWPEPEHAPELDEHHGLALMAAIVPELAQRGDDVGQMVREAIQAGPRGARQWIRVLRWLMTAWAREEVGHPSVEPFAAFRARTRGLLERVADSEGTIVAFTSGGTIGSVVAACVGAGDATAIELMWSGRNASITEVRLGAHGPALLSFNSVAHLREERLITFV